MRLPEPRKDGETYLTTTQSAFVIGVATCTISAWRKRGWITPIPGSPNRRPVYRLSELRLTEQVARENAIKATGTDERVRRLRGVTDDV